jgi:hypothetical protein
MLVRYKTKALGLGSCRTVFSDVEELSMMLSLAWLT